MQNSLLWKLVFAFMLVAMLTAGLVAVFIRLTSVDRLTLLVIDQERSSLKTSLTEYYTEKHSWEGIDTQWKQIRQRIAPPYPTQPVPDPNRSYFEPPRDKRPPPEEPHFFFGLADSHGKVVIPVNSSHAVGSVVPYEILQEGTAILVDGNQVGTILNAPLKPRFNPAENLFLQRMNEALILAMLGAMLVALIIGTLLARTLIRPLQALTRAVQNITQGELEQEVKVTSKDEIGQLAVAFNKMSREVARINQLRRQMTADIAHDLRTPLMVIAGYIEAMVDGILKPTNSRLTIIYAEIERLQSLVSDLKILSQADAGELPLYPQHLPPSSLLERVAETFKQQAEIQHITLSVEVDEHLPEISVDEARMMQIFSNLMSNALRYTPEGGNIHLSAQASNRKVTLSIRDNGAGIPTEDLPNIFDRFYRVDKSRTETGETGLGLAIVKALVNAHHATIRVESQFGEFTAFHITFG
ncbi:MAG: ATP-binding protein [Chloroflexota bacterium]